MHDQLTENDIQQMKEELDYRRITLRPKLLEEVKTARAFGDLSENFEYKAAKREKNQNESRIRYLENMIRTAVVVEDRAGEDEVGMNRPVEVYFPEDDETETFRIVTTIRGNSLKGLISIDSPLGKALLRHKAGETVHVSMENGAGYDVVIRRVGEATDEAEDAIRGF